VHRPLYHKWHFEGNIFSKNLVLNEEGTAVSADKWTPRGKNKVEEEEESDEEESEEEEFEEEESEEEATGGTSQAQQPELTRAQRKQMKKDKKQVGQKDDESEEDADQDPLFANPNIAVGKKMDISSLSAPRELSRRERDEKAAKEAKERYWKLHAEGKTDQAKADLARLTKIRAEREAAAAKRKAEADAKAAEVETKRKEAAAKGKRL